MLRLLVVEDDQDTADSLSMLLRVYGHIKPVDPSQLEALLKRLG